MMLARFGDAPFSHADGAGRRASGWRPDRV
jgi:hypothetical protein